MTLIVVRKWTIILLITSAVIYIASRISSAPKIVLEEKRLGEHAQYGFAIEESRFGAFSGPFGTIVRLWGKGSGEYFEDTYVNTPRLRLVNIKEHEWLAENQVVLLRLDMEEDLGSYTQQDERWVLYNFRTGDLRTCSSFQKIPCEDLKAYARKLR